jgi:hypothetical protein
LVVASVFTLASMLKIWRFAFQQTPAEAAAAPAPSAPRGALLAMLAAIVVLGLAAGPVQRYGDRGARALLDTTAYDRALRSVEGHPARLGGAP